MSCSSISTALFPDPSGRLAQRISARGGCEVRVRMAGVRSRRRSLFDSDDEAEAGPAGENAALNGALSASTSSTSLHAAGNEEGEEPGEQTRTRKLEQRNSRLLFSDDEEEAPERPRASSNTTHRKTVLFDSDDELWFQPDARRKEVGTGAGEASDWQSKYEEERRKRLELERELAEAQEKLAALQTYAAAMETWVPADELAQLADQKQQEMGGRTKDEEEFDKEWQAMAQAEAERRAKKRQQRRNRAGNTSTRVHLRQARKSVRMAALTPPLTATMATSLPPSPTDGGQAAAQVSAAAAAPSAGTQTHELAGAATRDSPSMRKTLSADSAKQESVGVTDDGWDSSGSEGWSDDEPRPSVIEETIPPTAAAAIASALPSPQRISVRESSAPDDVEQQVLGWAQRNDIAAMLMTVQQVFNGPLPPPPAWQHRPSADDVRRAYLRVVRYCHPDKVAALGVAGFSGSQAAYHLAITQSKLVFGALTDAYSMYKQLNGL